MATAQQPDPRLVALVAAYQVQTLNIRQRLEDYIRAFWRSLGLYRDPQKDRYAKEVTPVILGAQRQMASVTSAFLASQRQLAIGGTFNPIPVDTRTVTGAASRLGADPLDVHGRPFHLVWRQLDALPKVPESIPAAITAGENRAVALALDDVQLAKNHTGAETAKRDDRIKYVERILEGESSCGLCIVASTQRYHPGKLMPIHGGCDCGQVFLYADTDPGQILHLARLQDVHDRIEQRFGASDAGARRIPDNNYDAALQYRDVLITHEHGELGAVLGVRGADFTGPRDLT